MHGSSETVSDIVPESQWKWSCSSLYVSLVSGLMTVTAFAGDVTPNSKVLPARIANMHMAHETCELTTILTFCLDYKLRTSRAWPWANFTYLMLILLAWILLRGLILSADDNVIDLACLILSVQTMNIARALPFLPKFWEVLNDTSRATSRAFSLLKQLGSRVHFNPIQKFGKLHCRIFFLLSLLCHDFFPS